MQSDGHEVGALEMERASLDGGSKGNDGVQG